MHEYGTYGTYGLYVRWYCKILLYSGEVWTGCDYCIGLVPLTLTAWSNRLTTSHIASVETMHAICLFSSSVGGISPVRS